MKPKEALIKDNYPGISMGKGRLPLAAIERLKVLAAQGWNVEGYTVSKPVLGSDKPVEVTKEKVSSVKEVIEPVAYRYGYKTHIAREHDTGVERSLKEACNNCGYSLIAHPGFGQSSRDLCADCDY
jgi:hypothetical protein